MTNEEVIDRSLNHSQIRGLITESLQKDPSKLCSGLASCISKWSVYGPTDRRAIKKWMRLTQDLEETTNTCPFCNGIGTYVGHSWTCHRCGGTGAISSFKWKGQITS